MENTMSMPLYEQPPMNPAPIAPITNFGVSDTIASMRWENDSLLVNLRIRLGGYNTIITADGRTGLQRDPTARALVNEVGIDRFVAIIHSVVNAPVALSNIDDAEANTLINQVLRDILNDIAINQQRYDIHPGDRYTVMSVLKTIVFMQLKRPVGGHEARNFRTQTIEQNMQQTMNTPQRQGNIFNPFSWGRR